MSEVSQRNRHQQLRARRVRAKLHGTAVRPRVTVFRTNQYIWVQVINDDAGTTLASANDRVLRLKKGAPTKTETATLVGSTIAESLKTLKIEQAIFDRGHYRYHGRVAAVAVALREAGIQV
ncbi:50S ribosomal protein L18 [Candidatus Woesebacteria bacterium]|nr:50S ribosomal protein L18 [Candidatus Woesebacteria bacterium]